jgi:hypothetical protein
MPVAVFSLAREPCTEPFGGPMAFKFAVASVACFLVNFGYAEEITQGNDNKQQKIAAPETTGNLVLEPCEKGKTPGQKYSKLYAPANLSWGMCPDEVRSAFSGKMKFMSHQIFENEGKSFVQNYSGEFSDFPADLQATFCTQTSLCGVAVKIRKDGYVTKTWEVVVEKLRKKFGRPKEYSKVPEQPGQANVKRLKERYPNTKNKAALIEGMEMMWGVTEDGKFQVADEEVKNKAAKFVAFWNVKGVQVEADPVIEDDDKYVILIILSPEGQSHLKAIQEERKKNKVDL